MAMTEAPRSDALRARLAALQTQLRAIDPHDSDERVNEQPLLAELEALRATNAALSEEVRSLSARVALQREQISETQHTHDTAMQNGLEDLRKLELAMNSQREHNAALRRTLHDAHETLRQLKTAPQSQEVHATETRQEPQEEIQRGEVEKTEKTESEPQAGEAAAQSSAASSAPTSPGVVRSASGARRPMRANMRAAAAVVGEDGTSVPLLRYSSLHFEAKLGAGVSSTVYRGTLDKTRVVAIKVLKVERAQKDLKDFRKELSILKLVHSPHVVEFIGATLEPKLCIVMELCPHGTVFHALSAVPAPCDDEGAPLLTWARVLTWCEQMATGMATLHAWEPQIVHRDLKPLNLLLDAQWQLKICDFGLSRYTSVTNADATSEELQTLTKLRGTYAYTAPEIYHKAQYSAKSDIYSIGVICWEMGQRLVTGTYARPYAEYAELKYDYQIIYQTATQHLRPTFAPAFPPKFKQIVQACWTPEPERRPNATQLLEGLAIARADFEKNEKRW